MRLKQGLEIPKKKQSLEEWKWYGRDDMHHTELAEKQTYKLKGETEGAPVCGVGWVLM